MNSKVNLNYTRKILLISFFPVSLISLILILNGTGSILFLILTIATAILLLTLSDLLYKKRIEFRWLICFAIINFLLIGPELSLRLIGFQYESGSKTNGLRPSHVAYFIPDKYLLWKRPPSDRLVNSFGFYGKEICKSRPKHCYRIIILGDSCAEQNYARLLEKMLNDRLSSDSVYYECISLSVAGYSSYQGKVIAHRYAKILKADLAVICYGWNDHWLAYQAPDEEIAAQNGTYIAGQLLHSSRFLQLCKKLVSNLRGNKAAFISQDRRVSINQYQSNITEIINIFSKNNTNVLLLTAPTSYYELGVPEYIINERFTINTETAIKDHRSYNQLLRDIANRHNVDMLDMETIFNQQNDLDKLFMNDGIHFRDEGLHFLATELFQYINNKQLII